MAKNKKYEDSHFEEYLETQEIVNIDIEKRMREAFDFNTQQMKIQQGFRYYDSTTMTIRYI